MLKKTLTGLAILFVLFTLIGFTLPTTFHVEQEEQIIAAPKMIFVFIGDLQNWKLWTVWAKNDPNTQYEHSDPSYGAGATQKWKSKFMGEGLVTVTEWSENNFIRYTLQIEGWAPSQSLMEMRNAPQGAYVKWTMEGSVSSNPYMRYMGLIMKWLMKRDFRQSLTNLKTLAENSVAAEVKGPWQKPPEPPPAPEPKPQKKKTKKS